jgi:hypothetical protein
MITVIILSACVALVITDTLEAGNIPAARATVSATTHSKLTTEATPHTIVLLELIEEYLVKKQS